MLKSNVESKVFVYVAGHGGAGFLPFSGNESSDDWLYADELNKLLN